MIQWFGLVVDRNVSNILPISAGYFHYLENPDNMSAGTVASFFNNENPEFIGLVGGLGAYSNQVLGSVFNKEPESFSSLPRQVKIYLLHQELDEQEIQ